MLTLLSVGCEVHLHPIYLVDDGGGQTQIPATCPNDLIGYATLSDAVTITDAGTDAAPTLIMDGGTRGGGPLDGGDVVTVNASDDGALDAFTMYAGDKTAGPLVIQLNGMLTIPPPAADADADSGQEIRVSSDKTVIGVGASSGLIGGGLALTKVSNVVIRNLVIKQPNTAGVIDAIHVETSDHIWIDHCDLSSGDKTGAAATYDGLVDITDGSDFVTISWTHYHDHKDTGIIGRSDSSSAAMEDDGKEHVTYDHDFFENVVAGPRIRFGTVHVLNCYFNQVSLYGVASTESANVRIEKSYFENVVPPGQDVGADYGPITSFLSDSDLPGYVDLVGNLSASSGANQIAGSQMDMWMPPYPFSGATDSAMSVPTIVAACAVTGKVN